MKAKHLIAELQKQDPEAEVFIEQGEEYDYMKAYHVRAKTLLDADNLVDDFMVEAIVIDYN